ncbi:hypothetical protein [Pyrodictium abyssi]|uniref:DUF3800 domain-containing protein n=1 Tax=Pyrodictium abyssi TaxID=54256 RepID=A0ABN6ZMN5_9CREN|nr:hypothetical protein PABY_11030 [Pyrodictium abyssi]
MFAVCIDESGVPGLKRRDERYYVVAALGVPLVEHRKLGSIADMVRRFLVDEGIHVGSEIKGSEIHKALRNRNKSSRYADLIALVAGARRV